MEEGKGELGKRGKHYLSSKNCLIYIDLFEFLYYILMKMNLHKMAKFSKKLAE